MAELEKIIMESERGQEDLINETIQTEFLEEQKIDQIEISDEPVWEEIDLDDEEELPLNHHLEAIEESTNQKVSEMKKSKC